MFRYARNLAAATAMFAAAATGAVQSAEFIISTGLGKPHPWVGAHMDPFADAIEAASGGDVSFVRFYAGELTSVGRELDSLTSGTIHVAAPLLAPYHEGAFPLSDVTQLPAYGTTSPMVTRAFQNLLDSDVELKDGKTFYQYEIADKGIRAWALGATAPYSISTVRKQLKEPADFSGTPLRAGSALHTIVLEKLGATPVTLPGSQAFEAASRGTIEGLIIAISDWPSYSLQQLLRHSIVDVSIGHWESYLAVSDAMWSELTEEQQALFDKTAREIALTNADEWEARAVTVREESVAKDGGSFVSIDDLSPEMKQHIEKAAADTWIAWIEQTEAGGHPARATAQLYAELIQAEGGTLPAGVADYLAN